MQGTARARHLRRQQTKTEARLWRALRMRQLGGVKFRRQHPVGRYILDFACPELGLAIEVDGGQHALRAGHDNVRTAALARHGYTVLRFWNNEVLENIEGVMDRILAVIHERRQA
ncbi:endonuclease domain-containing protein [Ferruginivarius sediminum]|nr:endonuclease domain-containing protein [Ferruginivarius sediminum]